MKIAVCIAPITDPGSVSYDLEQERLGSGEITANPLDWVALAWGEAFLRAAGGGELIAVSVGADEAGSVLRAALIRGAHRAIHISSTAPDLGPRGIAAALAPVIKRLECDVVLCGARCADFESEFIGNALAYELDYPSVSRIVKLEQNGAGRLHAEWKVEGGRRELYSLPLPAVVAVEAELATAAYVPIMSRGYRAGLNKPIELIDTDSGHSASVGQLSDVTFVAAKPRTKRGLAPTSYLGEFAASEQGDPAAMLEFNDDNSVEFLTQLRERVDRAG